MTHGRPTYDSNEIQGWADSYDSFPILDPFHTNYGTLRELKVKWQTLLDLSAGMKGIEDLRIRFARVPMDDPEDNPGDLSFIFEFLDSENRVLDLARGGVLEDDRPAGSGSAVIDPCVRPPGCN